MSGLHVVDLESNATRHFAALDDLLRSGAIKGSNCASPPNRQRPAYNRGNGRAIRWLLEHIDFNEDKCLIWPFAKYRSRPSLVGYLGKIFRPSRLMCAIAHGSPPSQHHQASCTCVGADVGCINPLHLAWKTQSEFRRDQARAGRMFYGRQGKITPLQAAEIRALGNKQRPSDLARTYGLSPQRITGILQGDGFTKQRKPWTKSGERYFATIGYRCQIYSLGGFATAAEALAAYNLALEGVFRGEVPIVERRTTRQPDGLCDSSLTKPLTAFGDGTDFGRRIIAVEPVPEQSPFQLFAALEKLNPRVRRFVLLLSEGGEIEEAAADVGFDAATLAVLLPRLLH
jgi:hypothetical protein